MKKKLMACAAFLLLTLALTGCGSQFGDKMEINRLSVKFKLTGRR